MAGNGKGYGPSVQIARLFECTSKNGNTYFRGRLGSAALVILKSNETADSGAPVWNVLLQEAPPKAASENRGGEVHREPHKVHTQRARDDRAGGAPRARQHQPQADSHEADDWQRSRGTLDEPIPF